MVIQFTSINLLRDPAEISAQFYNICFPSIMSRSWRDSDDLNLCSLTGSVVITSQPRDPRAMLVKFYGFFPVVSELDYLLDVPREQNVPVKVTYFSDPFQLVVHPDAPQLRLVQGAVVRVSGLLHVGYNHDGRPSLSLMAISVRPQPEDPPTAEDQERPILMKNPSMEFIGVVVAIPVERPQCLVYTLRLFRDDNDHEFPRHRKHYSPFEMHCAVPMTARRANTPLPQINDVCVVAGELAGIYKAGDVVAPLIQVVDIEVPPPPREDDSA